MKGVKSIYQVEEIKEEKNLPSVGRKQKKELILKISGTK